MTIDIFIVKPYLNSASLQFYFSVLNPKLCLFRYDWIKQNSEYRNFNCIFACLLKIILLFPIPVLLDLPLSTTSDQQQVSDIDNQSPTESFFGIRDISLLSIIRILSLSGVIALVGYLIYARARRIRKNDKKR